MSGKPQSRLDYLLADALRRPRLALPHDIPTALADRLTRLALAGASVAELAAAAGDTVYADGYRRALLRDHDFRELRRLVGAAPIALERLDAEISPRALEQRRLVRLLTSPTTIDDGDDAAPIWPELLDPLIAAADAAEAPIDATSPGSAAAPIATTTTTTRQTTTKERRK
jgi:hypothetical protein